MKRDLTSDCLEKGIELKDLRETFCIRCKNTACVNAGGSDASPAWANRMDTQVDRLLLNPNIMQEGFEDIRKMPFESLLQDAIRVGKAVKSGDWGIEPKHNLAWRPSSYQQPDPEPDPEPAYESEPEESFATTDEEMDVQSDSFNDARKVLRGESLEVPVEPVEPETEEPSDEPEKKTKFVLERVVRREPPSNPVGHAPPMGGSQAPQSASTPRNTTVPTEGVMVGGSIGQSVKPSDPWGPAPTKVKTVPVGTKIKM